MKSPDLAVIPDGKAPANAKKAGKPKIAPTKAKAGVKRSFSLSPSHDAYINKIALKASQKRGKQVSASEALRIILDEHEASQ